MSWSRGSSRLFSLTLLLCSSLLSSFLPTTVHAIYEAEGQVGGKRTLVLLDSFEVKETHSLFFAGIAARGHTLTYLLANSPDVVLYKYGEPVYDNLFLFAPTTQEFATLNAAAITGFVQKGGNLIMAGDKEMSDLMREVAADFGVELDKRRALVTDHFSYEPTLDFGGSHVSVVSSAVLKNEKVVGKAVSEGPFVYRGIGHTLEKDNVLAMRVLTGASSTYSAVPGKEIAATGNKLETAGSTLTLISAIQGRNNARVVFCGSLDFFSDAFFTTPLTTTGKVAGNKALALELGKWGLGERGILRASNVTHHRADGTNPEHLLATKEKPDLPFSLFPDPELNRQSLVYRIKDDIIYALTIQEYDADKGGWHPYQAKDLQLEFVMLDPHVRTFMDHDGKGRFYKLFKVPDVYGVFKFRILYRRPGLSTLAVNTQVSVRPFNHDEYERFIFSAYPYYTSAFSMMAGFLVFGVFFLYSKPKPVGAGSSSTSAGVKKD